MQMALVVHVVYVYVCRHVNTVRELEPSTHYCTSNFPHGPALSGP